MDASIHDWLEGRGPEVVLITMIDDATSLLLARFYPAGTVETHLDLLGRWLRKYGRPAALYTDRHSIFEVQDKGHSLPGAQTQFGRALGELEVELIRARSPQAKGRVERSFGTAQDRWVKELRLAGARTAEEANEVLARLLPAHNRKFSKAARSVSDGHRPLGPGHDLASILSVQSRRVVSNDYTVRFENRMYQIAKPALPGLRGGKVVIEQRLDGAMVMRLGTRVLQYQEVEWSPGSGGLPAAPAHPPATGAAGKPPRGRSRGGKHAGPRYKPSSDHPWRKPLVPQK